MQVYGWIHWFNLDKARKILRNLEKFGKIQRNLGILESGSNPDGPVFQSVCLLYQLLLTPVADHKSTNSGSYYDIQTILERPHNQFPSQ